MSKQDAKLTLKEIATSVDISSGSVLTKQLKLRKVSTLLTEEQKVIRVKMAKVFFILKIQKLAQFWNWLPERLRKDRNE